MKNQTKTVSIIIIGIIYLIAILLGYFVFITLNKGLHELVALFLADVVATVVVWGFGLFYKNVSVYDPYWSVAPPVMFTVWAFYKSTFTLPVVLLLIAVWYWGIRLTGNWAYTFKGLAHEDWRYTRYRETQSPFIFHIINFFGLNMMPTVLVFAAMLPGFGLFESTEAANMLTWLGFAICISAASLQLIADTQIRYSDSPFPRRTPRSVLRCGLLETRPSPQLSRRNLDVVGRLDDVCLSVRLGLPDSGPSSYDGTLPVH